MRFLRIKYRFSSRIATMKTLTSIGRVQGVAALYCRVDF